MTTAEGGTRGGASPRRKQRRPGSPRARLAEASQQLEIVLEEVDLQDQPELGDSVVDALDAVDEATEAASRAVDAASRRSD